MPRRDVRRRDRGQRPTATEEPNPKPPSRRQSRHCSRARWSRLSHAAYGTPTLSTTAYGTPTLSTTNPDKSGCPRFRSRYRSHIRSRTSLRKSFLYIPTTSKQPDSRVFYHHQSDHHSAEATHLLRLAINSNNPKASKVVEGSGIAPATMAGSGSLS